MNEEKYASLLKKEIGTVNKHILFLIDESLVQKRINIINSIEEYNKNVQLLNKHCNALEIDQTILESKIL